jgi:hypothetical protein
VLATKESQKKLKIVSMLQAMPAVKGKISHKDFPLESFTPEDVEKRNGAIAETDSDLLVFLAVLSYPTDCQ